MPPFPSPDWVAHADRALAEAPDLADTLGPTDAVVGYVVDGDPALHYHLAVADGRARMRLGPAPAGPVLRTDAATATALHAGTLSFSDAVLDGRLLIEGDASSLLAAKPALDAVRAVLDRARDADHDPTTAPTPRETTDA